MYEIIIEFVEFFPTLFKFGATVLALIVLVDVADSLKEISRKME